ncbi:MAG: GDP-L-fucose synthase [Pseudomonadota bacterium]
MVEGGLEGRLETPFPLTGKRIWVAGHTGLVGSALVRRLKGEGVEILTIYRSELDLRDQSATHDWVSKNAPDVVVLAAAKVGGIHANNTQPTDFINDNLLIQNNVLRACFESKIQKALFLGSSCVYPKNAPTPITENALLTGPLEPTNEAYAIAKIAGIKQCQAYRDQYGADFITAMPCNLYGPNDNFSETQSHVLPALMMRAHKAKIAGEETLTVWGSGTPKREFMHVDDLADALVFLLQNYSHRNPVNIGTGAEIAIADLARIICERIGFKGALNFDTSMPDGVMSKCLDISKMQKLGWMPRISLDAGIKQTYEWVVKNDENNRRKQNPDRQAA